MANVIEGDCRYYAHLPYFVDSFIGEGWTCVGDAGGFLDPFYSPGSDFIAMGNDAVTDLVVPARGAVDDVEEPATEDEIRTAMLHLIATTRNLAEAAGAATECPRSAHRKCGARGEAEADASS